MRIDQNKHASPIISDVRENVLKYVVYDLTSSRIVVVVTHVSRELDLPFTPRPFECGCQTMLSFSIFQIYSESQDLFILKLFIEKVKDSCLNRKIFYLIWDEPQVRLS